MDSATREEVPVSSESRARTSLLTIQSSGPSPQETVAVLQLSVLPLILLHYRQLPPVPIGNRPERSSTLPW